MGSLLNYNQDSDTNPNTTASSIVGDGTQPDGRKRRIQESQLRKSVFGKKRDRLDVSKVRTHPSNSQNLGGVILIPSDFRRMIP